MIVDDDDGWIEIDEDAPPTQDPNSRRGTLIVAAKAADGKDLNAEARRYLDQAGLPKLVIFDEPDDDGVSHVSNIEEFRAYGYRGSDDPIELEEWLASRPHDSVAGVPFALGEVR